MTCRYSYLIPIAILIGTFASTLCAQTDSTPEEIGEIRTRAEEGNAQAPYDLAYMYGAGKVVPQDFTEMVRLLRLAGNQGHVKGQYDIASIYDKGLLGIPKDAVEANRWFRLAADQGYTQAHYALGLAYSDGKGVPQDAVEALRWYRLAADNGHANGQFLAGAMLLEGKGIPIDYVEAHLWLNLYAAQSSGEDRETAADARDLAARQMTSEQLVEAQRLAREWKPAAER